MFPDTNDLISTPGRPKVQLFYHSDLLKPCRKKENILSIVVNIPEEPPLESHVLGRAKIKVDAVQAMKAMAEAAQPIGNQIKNFEEILIEYQDNFSDKPGQTEILFLKIELTAPSSLGRLESLPVLATSVELNRSRS